MPARFPFICFCFFVIALSFLTGCKSSTSVTQPLKPTFEQVFELESNNKVSIKPLDEQTIASLRDVKYPQWLPLIEKEGSRKWEGIIIHHSASDFGDATTMDKWHKEQGLDELGYHFVICNGINAMAKRDGEVEVGYRWMQQKHGAHCRVSVTDDNYWNEHYIGICLVGNFEKNAPTEQQYKSLANLIEFLSDRYGITPDKIVGHNEAENGGTLCPGRKFSWQKIGLGR